MIGADSFSFSPPLLAVGQQENHMKKVLLALSIIACFGCAGSFHITSTPEKVPDTSAIISVIGRFVQAHACPIDENLALTNAHVTDMRPFDLDLPPYPLIWSDEAGNEGEIKPVQVEANRDLALMYSAKPFVKWYTLAKDKPKPGDKLWTIGYDWRRQDDMYSPRLFTLEVLRVVAHNVIFKPETTPGSSGACLLNKDGEVVAINAWTMDSDDGRAVSLGVGVWGDTMDQEDKKEQ